MIKLKNILAALALMTVLSSCDDTTEFIGKSIVDSSDTLSIKVDAFEAVAQSVALDSVYGRSTTSYLGKVVDPQTHTYVVGNFMTQLHTLQNYAVFPEKDSIKSSWEGEVAADSCELVVYYSKFYGDSLAPMKVRVYPLSKPMLEKEAYYTNFDPIAHGYVATKGWSKDKVYTIMDQSVSAAKKASANYTPSFSVPLNETYTSKDGKSYNNIGTYIMREYYRNPESFKNSMSFIHDVLPGFYLKHEGGLGAMAYVNLVQLFVYYKYSAPQLDSVVTAYASFAGNEEVLQTNYIHTDKAGNMALAADDTAAYVKTPAGIYTSISIPVDEMLEGKHQGDSLNSVKLELKAYYSDTGTDYDLPAPSTLLILPRDEYANFFENRKLADNKVGFLATYDSKTNSYVFQNISGLIRYMKQHKNKSIHWNEALVVPVKTTYTVASQNTPSYLIDMVQDLSLSSVKLVGGVAAKQPIRLEVLYSKF